ncbi:excitatory amino acid transporter 2-like [Tropilaelaps mercedesae]|uniref:Amino acid transporter n=1 Tax=Tropilaelaps mercedesae TaxID=418985 RepID=A0A1V9Y392_9ACAR|nr:excitatory amino acid transporter 2-like [Tropilaelaps mercedesae]
MSRSRRSKARASVESTGDEFELDEPTRGGAANDGNVTQELVIRVICCSTLIYSSLMQWLERNLLLALTVVAVLLGVGFGFLGRLLAPSPEIIMIVSFPGEILIGMLNMMVLPLITCSIVSGLTQLDGNSRYKLGTRVLFYYLTTTIFAVTTGILLATLLKPGYTKRPTLAPQSEMRQVKTIRKEYALNAFLDVIQNMFPDNLMLACIRRVETTYRNVTITRMNEASRHGFEVRRNVAFKEGTNMLGLVVFSTAVGLVAGNMGAQADLVIVFFAQLNDIIMKIIALVMCYSPVGILSLIMGKIMSLDDVAATTTQVALYMTTVIAGLVIHGFIVLPLLYYLITRENPFFFMKHLLQACIIALGTASSAATLPVTFHCLEQNLHIDKRVTRFVLPIGATVNMDGTALYEAVAAIFIAQINRVYLTPWQLVIVSLTASLASIGAASIPSAGLLTLLLVLQSVGLPIEDLSLIITVDWILDRLRTAINVLGDAYGAAVLYHLSKKELTNTSKGAAHYTSEEGSSQQDEVGRGYV